MKSFIILPLSILSAVLCVLPLAGQPAASFFDASYNGNQSNLDVGWFAKENSDGSFILMGTMFFPSSSRVALTKITSVGTFAWAPTNTRTFGSSSTGNRGYVQQTIDGGYVIATSSTARNDMYLIKTDSNGTRNWSKTYGGSGSEICNSAQEVSDGYILAGSTTSFGAGGADAFLVKTDSSGTMQWNKTFGGNGTESAESVQKTSDGGYILVGYSNSIGYGAGGYDVMLVKTYSDGNFQFYRTFGGSLDDRGLSVHQTTDGGYIIAGRTESFGAGDNQDDVYLIKVNSSGNHVWSTKYGGNVGTTKLDYAWAVRQTSDGGFVLSGMTYTCPIPCELNGDMFILKTNSTGIISWSHRLGSANVELGGLVQQLSNGKYIVIGSTDRSTATGRDVNLHKIDSDGAAYSCSLGATSLSIASVSTTQTNPAFAQWGGSFTPADISNFNNQTASHVMNCSSNPSYFIRGDVDSNGIVNFQDYECWWNWFNGLANCGPTCDDALDVNDSGQIDISDGIYLGNFVNNGGSAPPAPYPGCGPDTSADSLGCSNSFCF